MTASNALMDFCEKRYRERRMAINAPELFKTYQDGFAKIAMIELKAIMELSPVWKMLKEKWSDLKEDVEDVSICVTPEVKCGGYDGILLDDTVLGTRDI
jgi:hypothetical protein